MQIRKIFRKSSTPKNIQQPIGDLAKSSIFDMKSSRAFTLIELLVVISIIGMLSSVIMVALQGARDKGQVGAGLKFATYNYRAFGADAFGIWDFNDTTANVAADTSGNGNDLTFSAAGLAKNNASPGFTPSGSGLAMHFTGVGGYLGKSAITSGKNICNTTSACSGYTSSVWINPTNITGTRFMFEMKYNAVGNRYIVMQTSQFGGVQGIYCGDNTYNVFFAFTPKVNTWQHIACSYKNTVSPGTMSLYVNGKFVESKPPTAALNLSRSITNITVGNYEDGLDTNTTFLGKLDDLAIYSQALTAMEVQKLYAAGLPTHTVAER